MKGMQNTRTKRPASFIRIYEEPKYYHFTNTKLKKGTLIILLLKEWQLHLTKNTLFLKLRFQKGFHIEKWKRLNVNDLFLKKNDTEVLHKMTI